MTRFSDLPFELQSDIWVLVLPHQGGVHRIEIEGFPQPREVIKESLRWNQKLFDGRAPCTDDRIITYSRNPEFKKYFLDLDPGSLFFRTLYATVPSVFGKQGRRRGGGEEFSREEELGEVAEARRFRRLSTYTQVATQLQACRTSRLAALAYLRKMLADGASPLYRSGGYMYRARPLQTWRRQYLRGDENMDFVPEEPEEITPTICGPLDLVIYRCHTPSGHPRDILRHVRYQMHSLYSRNSIPWYNSVGIEWHPSWAAAGGTTEDLLCPEGFGGVQTLSGQFTPTLTQLYWLIDGIPRQEWGRYPAAIPIALNRVIENQRPFMRRFWKWMDNSMKERLLRHHDLQQEFEANGRRYYIVFVIANWTFDSTLEEEFRDPGVCWDGPFLGGEDLWPEALRDLVSVAGNLDLYQNMWTSSSCTYVLSWEPI